MIGESYGRGLYLTAALCVGFWINALASWMWWTKLARDAQAASRASIRTD